MNGIDIAVVVIVVLLVLCVIFFRFVLPNLLNKRVKGKGKEGSCGCANCQRH